MRQVLGAVVMIAVIPSMLLCLLSLYLHMLVLTSLDVISVWWSCALSAVVVLAMSILITHPWYKVDDNGPVICTDVTPPHKSGRCRMLSDIRCTFRHKVMHPKTMLIIYVVVSTVCLCCLLLLEGTCHQTWPANVMDTRLVRRITGRHNQCRDSICHLYFTVPEDACTSIIVNFHSGHSQGTVYYGRGSCNSTTALGTRYYHKLDMDDDRYIHWTLIDGLTSGEYCVYVSSDGMQSEHVNIRIPVCDGSTPIRVVSGGDVGVTIGAYAISNAISHTDPDVIVVGGDLAHAPMTGACTSRWDQFLWMLERNTRALSGRSVPFIMVAGNHEDSIPLPGIRQYPFYQMFWPQTYRDASMIDIRDTDISVIAARPSYHVHTYGSMMDIVVLDSGVFVQPEHQSAWLSDQLNRSLSSNVKYRVVAVHVPMYPSVIDKNWYPLTIRMIRSWDHLLYMYDVIIIVIYRHRYRVNILLEHHMHRYKRSVLMNGHLMAVGEGCWGMDPLPRSRFAVSMPNPRYAMVDVVMVICQTFHSFGL